MNSEIGPFDPVIFYYMGALVAALLVVIAAFALAKRRGTPTK